MLQLLDMRKDFFINFPLFLLAQSFYTKWILLFANFIKNLFAQIVKQKTEVLILQCYYEMKETKVIYEEVLL